MQVEVINKKKSASKVRVMTIDGGAHAVEDYTQIDVVLEFTYG